MSFSADPSETFHPEKKRQATRKLKKGPPAKVCLLPYVPTYTSGLIELLCNPLSALPLLPSFYPIVPLDPTDILFFLSCIR